MSPWKCDYMVVRLLIVLDWNIFHIYFLPMLPTIHYGHNLQVMGSKLETYKTPTLNSGIFAPYLRQHFPYFKFRSNRDILDFSFPSGFNSLTPWEFWEAGWVFSKNLWIGILFSGDRLFYHEEKTCRCTSETTSSILNPSEKKCRQHSMAKLPLHWRIFLSITKNSCAECLSSQLLQIGGPRSLMCVCCSALGNIRQRPRCRAIAMAFFREYHRPPAPGPQFLAFTLWISNVQILTDHQTNLN